jgi:hypothetical protein
MADESGRPLADVYAAWSVIRKLTVADVHRASGLARHTVENIRDARGRHPTRVTLQRLAVGLATDAGPGRYHEGIMKEVYRDLSLAAGYGEPDAADVRSLMDLALFYRFRSAAKAHVWASLMDRLEEVDAESLRDLFAPLGSSNNERPSTE